MSLVPTYRQCGTGANPETGQHSEPLAVGSCGSPTTGTAHIGEQAAASALVAVIPDDPGTSGDETDVSLTGSLSDVRADSASGDDYDPNPDGPDLSLGFRWRFTDLRNGTLLNEPGTTTDMDFEVPFGCNATSDPAVGSDCLLGTSVNAVSPGALVAGDQTVAPLFRVRVTDSGPDGAPGGTGDSLLAQQGIYVP